MDPNCNKFHGSICVKCSRGAFLNEDGICIVSDPLCKENNHGICVSCYPGYFLSNDNHCIEDREFNCYEWVGRNCAKCSKGYYFDQNKKCQLIDPLCREFDAKERKCESCYVGYALYQGKCLFEEEIPSGIMIATRNCA